ncbi:WD40 repeat-like protein [Sarocladium strictum]
MVKRKRHAVALESAPVKPDPMSKKHKPTTQKPAKKAEAATIQVVAGSYDRVLHGFTATINGDDEVEFADSFLFNAHTSAIRCLAISPPSAPTPSQGQKVFLASGSTDERVNVYNLSAHPPSMKKQDILAKVAPRPIRENRKNRELGTLLHHASTVTALEFPTRSKLLSASEDSTIGVTRTRDWSLLSSVKAPIPMPLGRPSGDTAPFGGTPAGVNDFAVHPSMKVMLSVSKSERCMRLWNLLTGKKAGVLNFDRGMLAEVGERRHATGEGRKVVWGNVDEEDEFAVAFDKDLIVFGMNSVPKCRVMPTLRTKVHHVEYIKLEENDSTSLLAVSTEDGRIMLFSTREADIEPPKEDENGDTPKLGLAKFVAHLGGKEAGVDTRIKEFSSMRSGLRDGTLYFVSGSSDGKARLWTVSVSELNKAMKSTKAPSKPAGKLLGTYETQNRITCTAAFVMIPRPEGVEDSDDEVDEQDMEEDEAEDDDGDDSDD